MYLGPGEQSVFVTLGRALMEYAGALGFVMSWLFEPWIETKEKKILKSFNS